MKNTSRITGNRYKEGTRLLEGNRKRILIEAARLEEVFFRLVYEGKLRSGRNLRKAEDVLVNFSTALRRHAAAQERVLYPFLQRHIPKFEPVTGLLISDHRQLFSHFKNLGRMLCSLKRKNGSWSAGQTRRLREEGIYLTHFLRHHLKAEEQTVYRAVRTELKNEEREKLWKEVNAAMRQASRVRC